MSSCSNISPFSSYFTLTLVDAGGASGDGSVVLLTVVGWDVEDEFVVILCEIRCVVLLVVVSCAGGCVVLPGVVGCVVLLSVVGFVVLPNAVGWNNLSEVDGCSAVVIGDISCDGENSIGVVDFANGAVAGWISDDIFGDDFGRQIFSAG